MAYLPAFSATVINPGTAYDPTTSTTAGVSNINATLVPNVNVTMSEPYGSVWYGGFITDRFCI